MSLSSENLSPELQPRGLTPLEVIRTETVLCKLPIHNLAKRGRLDIHISKKNDQGKVNLYWKVSPNRDAGEPRQLAYKIDTLIVNRRIDELGRPLPRIIKLGNLKEIAVELGITTHNTKALKEAITQNAGAMIIAKLTYKGRDGTEKSLDARFHRYSVIFTGESLPDGSRADAVYLVLDQIYWEVLNNAPDRPLDYNYLKALPPSAQRFYELLSFRIYGALMYHHPEAKILYSEYCLYSAQPRYLDYEHVKKQLYKIQKPHLDSGYLAKTRHESTVDDDGKPDWILRYTPGPKAKAEFETFHKKKGHEALPEPTDGEGEAPVHSVNLDARNDQTQELVAYFYKKFHGIENANPARKELTQAAELIQEQGFAKAKHVIDFCYVEAAKTKFAIQFFGGVLSYTARAVAAYAQHQEAEERRRREQAAKEEEERRGKEDAARDEDLLAQLSPQERERLFAEERETILATNPIVRKFPNGKTTQILIRGAVLRRLKSQSLEA